MTKQIIVNKINISVIIFLLGLCLVSDAANSVLQYYSVPIDRISVMIKAITEVIILLIFLPSKILTKQYLLLIFLTSIFLISYLILLTQPNIDYSLDAFIILNKYYFFIVLSFVFISYDKSKTFTSGIKKLFEYFIIINSILIVLGLVFDIELFSSYFKTRSDRFGYKGVIPAQNEASGVYFFGLAYYFREFFVANKKVLLKLLLVSFASLVIGTKGTWIALVAFTCFFLWNYRRIYFFYSLPLIFLFIAIFGNDIWLYLYHNYLYYFIYFINKADYAWYSIILSGRDYKTGLAFDYIRENWTVWNYIFGGINLKESNSEMDIFDGYFMFGIGYIVYLVYYTKVFFIKDFSLANKYIFFIFIVLAFTGGHMIYSAIVPFFLLSYVFSYGK